ncbi:hypothetical protein ACVIHH_005612 [Bradyrhizobium sp. USDA 4518]|uniref:Uncharacterized protein n=1 Tax=Bradyrhizobium brasilense TaxID=1419277 RepID=A0ABY8JK75_9BRAD|nr:MULTISPECIES: hypothetical protein [Bradyrhizobium]MCP1829768.1 hypothetical protein [Bradyrhizobium sp. USDA 4545]MCP1922877.1 hypothetical protein [Bradyrhizobium sp. USDA 4532]WFU64931.1 hypothetical protein QA636_05130 [Bradyrhizobium brasilense]
MHFAEGLLPGILQTQVGFFGGVHVILNFLVVVPQVQEISVILTSGLKASGLEYINAADLTGSAARDEDNDAAKIKIKNTPFIIGLSSTSTA